MQVINYYLYILTFDENKKYIGLSRNPRKRFKKHDADADSGSMLPVHCAFRQAKTVEMAIVARGSREEITALEISEIARLGTLCPGGYNLSLGGDISPTENPDVLAALRAACAKRRGVKFSKEHCQKISRGHKGKAFSDQHRANLSVAMKSIWTPERRAAFGLKQETWWTPERRVAVEANKKTNPRYRDDRVLAQKNVDQVAKGKKISASKLLRNVVLRSLQQNLR